MSQKQFPRSTTALAVAAALGAGSALVSPVASAGGPAPGPVLDNTDRLGDAAIVQYYTAKDTWQTFFRLINTSNDAVVVKVRFREAANSREVLDFFVALSPYDMWAGWTDKDALGTGAGPGVRTNDTSCIFPAPDTAPTADGGFKTISGPLKAALFKKAAFTGVYDDKAGLDPVDRMSEGHIEVIGVSQYSLTGGSTAQEKDFVNFVSHGPNGYPANCGVAANLFFTFDPNDAGYEGREVQNVIGANAYLTNIATGQGAGFDPDILRDCSKSSLRNDAIETDTDPDLDSCDAGGFGIDWVAINQRLWNGAEPPATGTTTYKVDLDRNGTIDDAKSTVFIPGAADCENLPENDVPKVVYDAAVNGLLRKAGNGSRCDVAIVQEDGQLFFTDEEFKADGFDPWREKQKGFAGDPPVTGGVDAVSAQFMRASVINEWAASNNPAAVVKDYYTQWVLTFPTKHYYVDLQDDANLKDDISPQLVASTPPVPEAFAPFYASFAEGAGVNLDNVEGKSCEPFEMWMFNREERFALYTSPGPYVETELCYETNVITFDKAYEDQGLASTFSVTIPVEAFPTDASGAKSERGWAELYFTGPGAVETGLLAPRDMYGASPSCNSTDGCKEILYGLPVTGFLFSVYETGNVVTNQASAVAHKYTRESEASSD